MPVQGFTAVVDITWGLSAIYPDAWLSLKVSPLHWQLPCDQQAGETCHSHNSRDYNGRMCGEPGEDGSERIGPPSLCVLFSTPGRHRIHRRTHCRDRDRCSRLSPSLNQAQKLSRRLLPSFPVREPRAHRDKKTKQAGGLGLGFQPHLSHLCEPDNFHTSLTDQTVAPFQADLRAWGGKDPAVHLKQN